MKFKVIENGQEIECNILKAFKDDSNNINYLIYTDGTKDENGNLEIYASRYDLEGNDFILNPIENNYEWNLIDNIIATIESGDN